MKYLLALDLETTGLDHNYNEIIQIGAILLDKHLNQLGNFESFVCPVHPERGIEKRGKEEFNVYKYIGIESEDLKSAPPLHIVIEKFLKFLRSKIKSKNLKHITIFGQNPKFDYLFLKEAFLKCAVEFPFNYHVIGLDSIYAFYGLIADNQLPSNIGLHRMCEKFGITNPKEHDAMADITVTISLLRVMLSDITKRLGRDPVFKEVENE